ncbi:MAG: nuclear transport factor 2 family protein [Polyangiaceae bacterium]
MSSTRGSATAPADFADFMKQREEAAAAYVCGDPSPLDAIIPGDGAATFFHPRGPFVVGAAQVRARYDDDAASFESGGTTHFEVLQSGASGDLAFWTGFQVAEVRMRGRDALVPMRLRVTEVFRRTEKSGWNLIHRHADPAVEEKR